MRSARRLRARSEADRVRRSPPRSRGDDGLTLVEVLVAMAVTGVIVPVMIGLIVSLVRGNINVQNTMTGLQQDQVAGEALLQYLHGATVILPGSSATTLNASILAGLNSSTYTPDIATLQAVLNNSASPTLDATFRTTLTPAGGTATSVGTYDAVNSQAVFTYYYNNVTANGSTLTSTTAPTNSELSEIVAVQVNVTFLSGPHVPAAGYQAVRATHFDTTIYLQNASGAPAPTTSTTVQGPSSPQVGSAATLTATVSPLPDGGTVTFTVTYGGSSLSVCTSPVSVSTTTGTASCTFTPASSGSYTVVAAFSGTSDLQPSTSSVATFVIPTATTTTLTVTASSTELTVSASVSPVPDGGTVTFTLTGGAHSVSDIQTVSTTTGVTPSYSFTGLSNSTTYTVTAQFTGSPDGNYASSTSSSWSGKP